METDFTAEIVSFRLMGGGCIPPLNRSLKGCLGLGLGFFCVLGLGLEPCVLDFTWALFVTKNFNEFWHEKSKIQKECIEKWKQLAMRLQLQQTTDKKLQTHIDEE